MSRVLRSAAIGTLVWIGMLGVAPHAGAAEPRPVVLPAGYQHERFAPAPEILRRFAAFTVSFDGRDDDDGDGAADTLRTPEWVAQHIKRTEAGCVDTEDRPNRWFTEADLLLSGIAPDDDSYLHSGYDRGHLAPKMLAARLGAAAEWNTHTVLNAVPQRPRFNRQPWRRLERTTGAWAQAYCQVWVMQGPVFDVGPRAHIGDEGERRVAIPHALYKIVVREAGLDCAGELPEIGESDPRLLVFLYPQLGPGYYERGVDAMREHARYLTSLSEVERLTGLTFFPAVTEAVGRRIRRDRASAVWPVEPPAGVEAYVEACRG